MSIWLRRAHLLASLLAVLCVTSSGAWSQASNPNDPGAAERRLLAGTGPRYAPNDGPQQGPAGNWGAEIGRYRDVPAYSNGVDTGDWSDLEPYGQDGYQYQCVEYCRRFYRVAMGYNTGAWYGNAVDWFAAASTRNLEAHPNDGTSRPQADDIVCFSSTTYGHVAIVSAVVGATVYLMQQNVSTTTGTGTLTINANGKTNNYGSLVVQGYLRKPGYTPTAPAMKAGDCAVVQNPGGTLNVRDAPNGNLLSAMVDGTVVSVLEGPKLSNGIWWYRHDHGGWSAYGVAADIYLAKTQCPFSLDDAIRAVRAASGLMIIDGPARTRLDIVPDAAGARIDLLDAVAIARKMRSG